MTDDVMKGLTQTITLGPAELDKLIEGFKFKVNDEKLYLSPIVDLFNGEVSKKKNYVPIMIALGLIVFLLWGMVIIKCIDSNYEFKTITTSCENFRINGSLAYNTKKATIYISNIEYCGGDNRETFPSISCTLYEEDIGLFKKVDSYVYEGNPITLEKFLKDVKFKIDDYDSICKDRNIHALYIDIIAKDDKERAKRYRVDLEVEDSCKQ